MALSTFAKIGIALVVVALAVIIIIACCTKLCKKHKQLINCNPCMLEGFDKNKNKQKVVNDDEDIQYNKHNKKKSKNEQSDEDQFLKSYIENSI